MAIVHPTVKHYEDFSSCFENEFRDYHLQACLTGDDGKDYYLTYTIARMENREFTQLVISDEPVWYSTTPRKRIIRKGEKPLIELGNQQRIGAMKTEASSSGFKASMGTFEATLAPPLFRFGCREKDVSVDLTLESLGLPWWINEGKEEGAKITPSTTPIRGFEQLGKVGGVLSIKGKEIHVKGVGVHEHFVQQHMAWAEMGWQDWIWFVSDEMYGLIFELHGGPYKDAGIYLIKEKEYLVVRDFDIDHPQWAYSPMLQHNIPIAFKVRASTDKGILLLEGDMIRALPWRRINKYRHAAATPSADTEFVWKGVFTYHDGRTLVLNHGKGGNECIANYNFFQSNG
jgi:hypothetical protein